MDEQRKRELKEAYRNSRPPMGVLSFCCEPTGKASSWHRATSRPTPTV